MKGWHVRDLEVRLTVEEGVSLSEAFRVFKDAVTVVTAEVVGYRALLFSEEGK